MCGIIGFTWADKHLIQKGLKHISHRGPDGQRTYIDSRVSLGHARLSIIDLSKKSDQPMTVDGVTLVFNGEIYNYQDVRKELEKLGHRFVSAGDTEVLLRAWKQWGRQCLEKFNGMFAFALYDQERHTLTLVRDRFGIKPLYYAIHKNPKTKKNSLVFSSELYALRKLYNTIGAPTTLSEAGFRDFLTFRYTLNQTLFAGMKKLGPGHILTFDLSTTRYSADSWYTLPRPLFMQTNTVLAKLPKLMRDSVRLRLISDVPVGFYLSGGIDSGLVTSLAVARKKKLGEASDSVKTFSVGFDHGSELRRAKFMAEHLGTDHTEVHVEDESVRMLDTIVRHMGEPIGDAAFLPTYIISREATKKITVAQAGEGADEIFGGYDRYKLLKYGRHLSHVAGRVPKMMDNPIYHRVARMHKKPEYQQHLQGIMLSSDNELGGPSQELSSYEQYYEGNSVLQRSARFDMQTLLPNDFFMKADTMPMAHGIEERVPFLDHRVVHLGLATPDSAKLRVWKEKWVLRKAFPQLPEQVRQRKKRGYETPMDAWFGPNGLLREQLGAYLDDPIHKHYATAKVREKLERFRPSDNYTMNFLDSQQLFSMLLFEIWYRQHFVD